MYRALADAIRDAEAQGKSLSQVALERECQDQGRPKGDKGASAVRRSVHDGLLMTRSASDRGRLPGVIRRGRRITICVVDHTSRRRELHRARL